MMPGIYDLMDKKKREILDLIKDASMSLDETWGSADITFILERAKKDHLITLEFIYETLSTSSVERPG